MIILDKNTERVQNWLSAEIQGYKLRDVYGRYSDNKEIAFNYCVELCEEKNGQDLCIISHNCHYFTTRFFTDEGMYIITYANNYFIEL